MRVLVIGTGLLFSTAALGAETMVVPDAHVPPTLTVEQPQNPASSKPGGPILQSISVRINVRETNGTILDVVPDFHFIAPNGNAVLLHREIVDTNANRSNVNSAPITIPAEAQKRGAVISGGWRCNVGQYYVTMKAYVLDADGNRSNTVQYTIHCNGG
jgi:hypothetical protein